LANNFDVEKAINDIKSFFGNYGDRIRKKQLHLKSRPSHIFETYVYFKLAERLNRPLGNVSISNCTNYFEIKTSPFGDPRNYSFFDVADVNGRERYLLKDQNINSSIFATFNVDVVLSNYRPKIFLQSNEVYSFMECKHFASISASKFSEFKGIAQDIFPKAFNPNYKQNYPKPSLVTSGKANSKSAINEISHYTMNFHLDFFQNVSASMRLNPFERWI
jgi:hypothetical protein